jgi:hypothetical protein
MARVFGGRTLRSVEMLRVTVVRGPKTFCKTIFHAKSLSENPGADSLPTRDSCDRCLSKCSCGRTARRIGSFRTIGKAGQLHAQSHMEKKLPVLAPGHIDCPNCRFRTVESDGRGKRVGMGLWREQSRKWFARVLARPGLDPIAPQRASPLKDERFTVDSGQITGGIGPDRGCIFHSRRDLGKLVEVVDHSLMAARTG